MCMGTSLWLGSSIEWEQTKDAEDMPGSVLSTRTFSNKQTIPRFLLFEQEVDVPLCHSVRRLIEEWVAVPRSKNDELRSIEEWRVAVRPRWKNDELRSIEEWVAVPRSKNDEFEERVAVPGPSVIHQFLKNEFFLLLPSVILCDDRSKNDDELLFVLPFVIRIAVPPLLRIDWTSW